MSITVTWILFSNISIVQFQGKCFVHVNFNWDHDDECRTHVIPFETRLTETCNCDTTAAEIWSGCFRDEKLQASFELNVCIEDCWKNSVWADDTPFEYQWPNAMIAVGMSQQRLPCYVFSRTFMRRRTNNVSYCWVCLTWIDDIALKCFTSFLSDRSQQTSYNDRLSNSIRLHYGVYLKARHLVLYVTCYTLLSYFFN